MKKYLKYIIMGVIAVALSILLFPKKAEKKGTPHDYAEIAESGILRAVMEYNSLSYHAEGDTVAGFHYELLNAFAKSKGLTPQITPDMSFSNRLEGVLEGKYDILANGTMVTSESKDSLMFTRPILLNKQVLVQRKADGEKDSTYYIHSQLDLARKTLHVVKGSPALLRIHNLSNEIGDTIYISEVEKYGPEQLLAMVAHGDIDYAVCDESIARASMSDFQQLDIETAISFTQFYSWGVSKHSPVLLDSLNSWLEVYTKTPEFKALQKKYYNN
ncbi:transporter substrate-binding domain-containing protein [Phocaeicola sp.]